MLHLGLIYGLFSSVNVSAVQLVYSVSLLINHAVILAHLNGRLVTRQVHDFLLGQEELVERSVDHGLSSPHVVDRFRSNATNLAPVNHCFLSDFHTYILLAVPFFSGFVAREKFLFGIMNVLGHITEVTVPTELVADDISLRHPVNIQVDFDQLLTVE